MEYKGSFLHSPEPATCPDLSQINPVHSPIPLSEIQFDIIPLSTVRASKWFLSLKTLYEPLLCQ